MRIFTNSVSALILFFLTACGGSGGGASGGGASAPSGTPPCHSLSTLKDPAKSTLYVYGDSITLLCTSWSAQYAGNVGLNLEQHSVNGSQILSPNQAPALLVAYFDPGSVLVYAPGHNDALLFGQDSQHLQDFRDQLTAIVSRLNSLGVTAYIGTPTRFTDTPEHQEAHHNGAVDAYAAITRDVIAHQAQAKLVDFNACFQQTPATSMDGIHPNAAGMAAMYQCFLGAL